MTIFSSNNARGFFEPITLVLHAPSALNEIKKYKDDVSLQDLAIFINELSYYF